MSSEIEKYLEEKSNEESKRYGGGGDSVIKGAVEFGFKSCMDLKLISKFIEWADDLYINNKRSLFNGGYGAVDLGGTQFESFTSEQLADYWLTNVFKPEIK